MYSKGNWFEIPLTRTFCGNQVLKKTNLSQNKYRNALKLPSLMQLRTSIMVGIQIPFKFSNIWWSDSFQQF